MGWLFLILLRGGYEARYLGVGSEEFKRVVTAGLTMLAVISHRLLRRQSAPRCAWSFPRLSSARC